jgi:carbamoyl-phosphate synthase small subunit
MKRNILRLLAAHGMATTVFPATTPPAEIAGGGFDGVFLSNGPGDPDATTYGIAATRELLGKVPSSGSAWGASCSESRSAGRTYKIPFGHRGVNQPVKDLATGWSRSRATTTGSRGSRAWVRDGEGMARTDYGRVHLSHWNLNDGTLEGFAVPRCAGAERAVPPRGGAGPARFPSLFGEFRSLMEAG